MVRRLGRGGMGTVLEAYDPQLERTVAIKVLHEAAGGGHEQRLLREAQALARVSHPNVVQVFDVDEIDGRLCMAMELVRGQSLQRWQAKPRTWLEVLEVYGQAGRGLAAAHAEGLVHRDFKPSNCILDEQGVVKVLDFGLARGLGGDSEDGSGESEGLLPGSRSLLGLTESLSRFAKTRGGAIKGSGSVHGSASSTSMRASRTQLMLEQDLTRTGTMLGTVAYMAPEQLLGKAAVPSSDQFSFCVSLYEALYGQRPFKGSTVLSTLYAIQSEQVSGEQTRPGLPPVPRWLLELLRRGLSVASHQRFGSMEALLAVIDRGLARLVVNVAVYAASRQLRGVKWRRAAQDGGRP